MQQGRARGRVGLAGAFTLAFALGLMPGAAPADEAAPVLALLAAHCSDPAVAALEPEGWATVPADEAAPLVAGLAGFEARIEQVLERPLADEPDLAGLLARRMDAWLAETREGGMQARLWQHEGMPGMTLLRAAESGMLHNVQCWLMIEDVTPAMAEALTRRFEILPQTQAMSVRVWAGGGERVTPAGPERHNRALMVLPAWSPAAVPAVLLRHGVTRVAP